MRKYNFILIILILTVLAGCGKYDPLTDGKDITGQEFPVLFMPKAGITIDGDTADWPQVIPAIMDSASQVVSGSRDKQHNYAAAVRILFDAGNLYLAADITDTSPFANGHKQDLIWQGDCLEIYTGFHAAENRSIKKDDFQIGIALVEQNPTVWNWSLGRAIEDREVVIKQTKNGCSLEARISLAGWGDISLADGDKLWVDFGLDNADSVQGDRTGQMIWYGNARNYQHPDLWRKAVLVKGFENVPYPVITGSAVYSINNNYRAHIFYKGKPWEGDVHIDDAVLKTDAAGTADFSNNTMADRLLSLKVDDTIYYAYIFGTEQKLREYARSTGGKKDNLPAVPDSAPYKDASLPVAQRVENLMSFMSLKEKIGQMTQIDRQFLQYPDDLATYGIGSLLSGGGSGPATNKPEEWEKMYNNYQKSALKSRLGIPLIYGIDAVHGDNNVRGAVIFPHNIGMGATGDPDLVERVARATAVEVSATGIDWTFAPCIAVPRNEHWGRTYEGFSEDPQLTALLGAAEIRGFQGTDLADPTTILATAKHFAGDGGTQGGVDRGNVVLDEKTFMDIHVFPYRKAVSAGVGSVMISFSSWNGVKMHADKHMITDVLKNKLQFKGFVVSDWGALKELPGTAEEQIMTGINAGIDMVMVPDDYPGFIAVLTDLVKSGKVSEQRIDDAVQRILTAKFELGLFETPLADGSLLDQVGSREHRELAREAVRKSLVLLKNKNNLLPLSKSLKNIHIAGALAKDIGAQCGGWTITWQGENGTITKGTTIYDAIAAAVSPDTHLSFSGDAADPGNADVIIAVVGEEAPYAEFEGDRKDLSLSSYSKKIIANAEKSGIPYVVILISGRPLIITDEIAKANAFLAAWLPGTEAEGIADVLFGDYKPTGKLAYTWPRSNAQIPINKGDGKKNPLFPFGYGLSY
ncbi:MAG: glycoside hydrolase family 3 N-terminal domain-containing protein [Spirochaetia bacterium]